MTAKPIQIINNNFINNRNSRNRIIKFSKTEIDLVKNFPNLNKIKVEINNNENNDIKDLNDNYYKINSRKINYSNNLDGYEYNSARSCKLNFTDFNNYMSHLQRSNNNNNRVTTNKINRINKGNKISLNKYFNLNKINSDKKNINSIKNLYNNINYNKKSKYSSYNSYITKKNRTAFINDITKIYHETGKTINNNINNNINKIKKEKELLNLKSILAELKLKNYKLENELLLLKEKNTKLEENKNIQNKKIYLNIKKILTKNIIIKNKDNNYTTDIDDISDINIINQINIKKYKSLPYKERAKYIRNIYLQEKLTNSLIDKTLLLYFQSNESYVKTENTINGQSKNNEDINVNNHYNIYKWIASMVDNIDKLKKISDKIQRNIILLKEDNENYKKYYNNWIKTFKVNNKEELVKKIDGLINYQNINENGQAKMIKILMNKKE